MFSSVCGGIGKTRTLFSLFDCRTLRRYQCWKQKGSLFLPVFTFHVISLFFFPAWRCISMQPAFRSRTWKCLTVFLKHREEVSGPAPLNPNRLSFAWCGCQVDALASSPRTGEIVTCLKKHVLLNLIFGRITVVRCTTDADLLSCQKRTSLDSTMNY